ncbi:MAG: hypothetical protein M1820_004916 [Bogoriella megaspora]|nr:MAG: hypothetical protein M1820_004916 [Bogoriella megaspora]
MLGFLTILTASLSLFLFISAFSGEPLGSSASTFYQGHDLSSLLILEEGGAICKDTGRQNETRPAEDILIDGGMNTVRLRIWVDPIPGQYDLNYTRTLAKRFAAKGQHIYLDFHFSDTWADPNHNNVPVAWPTTLEPLADRIRAYVNSTLISFHEAGVDLSLVSLGNEIRHGMLWPLGYVDVDTVPTTARIQNFTNLATLWKASRDGVSDAVAAGVSKPQVMIHIDDGYNLTLQNNWFDALTGTGIVKSDDWDIFGFSFYPFYGTAATLPNLQQTLDSLAKQWGKPLHVVETDWPVQCNGTGAPELSDTSVPVNVQGQIDWVRDIRNVVKQVPDGLGQGVNYWEPAWLNLTSLGSACQDAILFETDWSQHPTAIAYSRESVNMFR